jgi:hypothetical protein
MSDNNKQKEAWWQPAMVIFSQASAWIVVPIILALFVGKSLDNRYGTSPWIFLSLTGVAFAISCYGIVIITTRYTKKLEQELKDKQKAEDQKNNSNDKII